jgi:hypothetical protein
MQLGGSARRLGVVVSRDGDATGRWRVVSKEFETKSSYSRSTVRHRIILVRMAWFPYKGASCCDGFVGYLGACDHSDKPPPDFVDDRQRILAVYKALREELPPKTAEITVVDPWNMPYLLRAIWRDARNRGHSGWDVLRAIDGATAPVAVIVDGRVVCSRRLPDDPEEVVSAVFSELAAASTDHIETTRARLWQDEIRLRTGRL